MENQSQNKTDYYTSAGRKVGDFCIGFFGVWVLSYILSIILTLLFYFLSLSNSGTGFAFSSMIVIAVIALLVAIIGIIVAFKKGRRYIGIGIIVSAIIPLLLLGACWLILAGISGSFG